MKYVLYKSFLQHALSYIVIIFLICQFSFSTWRLSKEEDWAFSFSPLVLATEHLNIPRTPFIVTDTLDKIAHSNPNVRKNKHPASRMQST